jgi:hypothetical protein
MKYISIAKRAVGMTPEYSEEYIKEYEAGVARNDPNYPDVDWFDATATNNGLMTNQFVTVSLGTERLKSLTQAGYVSQNGITENTNYKRYTLSPITIIRFCQNLQLLQIFHLDIQIERNRLNWVVALILSVVFRPIRQLIWQTDDMGPDGRVSIP